LSLAVADHVAIPVQLPGVAFTVILDGQVIVGFSASVIVTVKLQVDEFPAASVDV
jgi:hypothetical protein